MKSVRLTQLDQIVVGGHYRDRKRRVRRITGLSSEFGPGGGDGGFSTKVAGSAAWRGDMIADWRPISGFSRNRGEQSISVPWLLSQGFWRVFLEV